MITVKDEELHTPGGSPHWQESYYFNWSNPSDGSFGLTRIGLNHATRRADAVLVTLADGGPELVWAKVGVPFETDPLTRSVTDGLSVADLTYTMVEPLGTWRIQLDGPSRVDLTWTATSPAVDFHHGFAGHGEHEQEHFEQSGRVTGTTAHAGVDRLVVGRGQRDKSWGVRDWNGIGGWDWIAAQFDDDLALNATTTEINGVRQPVGYVYDRGAAHPVKAVEIEYGWKTEHQPDSALIRVVTQDDRRYTFRATGYARCPLYKKGLFIEETPATFETLRDGQLCHGVGVIEHAYHVSRLGLLRRMPRLGPVIAKAARASR